MRRATAILMATGLVAATSAARAQTAMPNFSNPYGGVSAYVQDDAHDASSAKPPKKMAAKKPSGKIVAHSGGKEKTGAMKPVALQADDAGLAPSDNVPRPVTLAPSQAKQKDSALDFDMKWSASSHPIFNPAASTIPGVNEVKRSVNQDPVETGSKIQAGVKLKF